MRSNAEERTPRRAFRTTARDAGRPLADFIVRRCPEAPVGFPKRLLRKGFVLVDGEPARGEMRLKPGLRVVLSLPHGAFLVAPNPDVPFEIVHEDEHLLVVEKPAGVVSEPGIGHKLETLLNGRIARYAEMLDRLGPRYDFGMVHHPDRETAGLLVVAKRAKIQTTLAQSSGVGAWRSATLRSCSAAFRTSPVRSGCASVVFAEVNAPPGCI